MKTKILLLLALLIVSCGKTEAPKSNGEGVQTENTTSNTFNAGAPGNTGSGPTGTADPVDPTTLPGYVPPSGGDPVVVTPPGPVLTEVCGTAYASFYDNLVRLYVDAGTTHIISNGDSTADYYFSSSRLKYPNDVLNVCVQSYMDNGLLVASSVSLVSGEVMHPERPLASTYAYEVCGEFKYLTDSSARTYLEVTDNGIPYIVIDENSPALELPSFSDSEGASLSVKGCMYSAIAPYNDFSYTFKKHLKVQAFDFGPLLEAAN